MNAPVKIVEKIKLVNVKSKIASTTKFPTSFDKTLEFPAKIENKKDFEI